MTILFHSQFVQQVCSLGRSTHNTYDEPPPLSLNSTLFTRDLRRVRNRKWCNYAEYFNLLPTSSLLHLLQYQIFHCDNWGKLAFRKLAIEENGPIPSIPFIDQRWRGSFNKPKSPIRHVAIHIKSSDLWNSINHMDCCCSMIASEEYLD